SVSVSESDRIDLSVRGVGELAGEVYSEPDPNPVYGTKYFVPEGTHLRVTVDEVYSDEDWVRVIGNMCVKESPGAGTAVITSMKGTGLFNPEGLGYISPGACPYPRGGSSALCNLPMERYTHSFTGEGGVMYSSPFRVFDEGGVPYNVGSCVTTANIDANFSHKLRYRMETHPGYQHVLSSVYDGEGNLIETQPPPWLGVGSVYATHLTAPLSVSAETVEMPTVEVEIEVEEDVVPAAEAGYFTFDDDSYDAAK
ncbi:MAG: hypothetical protein GY851_31685, partial [bacterium]|nr:hypothetical protein [bacterium]